MKVLSQALMMLWTVAVLQAQSRPQYKEDLGQYIADNSGQYIHDDSGRYIPDHSGDYVSDGLGSYTNDGSGDYKGVEGGFYKGNGDGSYQHGSFFGKNSVNNRREQPIVRPDESPFNKINSANLLGAGSTLSKQTVRPTKIHSNDERIFENIALATSTFGVGSKLSGIPYDQVRYVSPNGNWKIIRQADDIDTDGYHWEYETENGITADESGKLSNKGTDKEAMKAAGHYKYTGPDNVVYSLGYTADERGFLPVGNHLPTPPPIPIEIQRSLDYLRSLGKL